MVRDALIQKQLLNTQDKSQVSYLVTDGVDRFCRIGQIFLREHIASECVQLIDA